MDDKERLSGLRRVRVEYDNEIENALPIIGISVIVFSVTRLFEIIKPIAYSSSYNDKLKQALYNNNLSFDVTPLIDFNGNAKLTAAVNYKY